jgi:hypothetical protein
MPTNVNISYGILLVLHKISMMPRWGRKFSDPSGCSSSQETPEEDVATAAKKMLSPNSLFDTTNKAIASGGIPRCLQPKKRKRPQKKDAKAKEEAKAKKEPVQCLDKLPDTWRPLHHLGEPMLPEHVVKKLIRDMRSVHETVLHMEQELLKPKSPGYPLHVAKVPTGMGFVDEYPWSLCFIRSDDIFNVFRMKSLHLTVVRLVALSPSSQIIRD